MSSGGGTGRFDPSVDPILCSPYAAPDLHWQLDRTGRAMEGVEPLAGRRASAIIRPVPDDDATAQLSMEHDTETKNELINRIRAQVSAWRAGGYKGVTSITRKLLFHWAEDSPHRQRRPFFAQREAIETLIWLREVATRRTAERRDLEAASRAHNDNIVRYCSKMATGTGKTAVMGMLIAWQTLNATRSRHRRNVQHSSRFLVLTPGLTVRDRLAVLHPGHPENVYDELGLVPREMRSDLSAARIEIVNFQAFRQRDPSGTTKAQKAILGDTRVDQNESREAMVRRVVGELLRRRSAHGDLVVINDEAHHCYLPEGAQKKQTTEEKESDKIAAVWFNAVRTLRDMGALGTEDPARGQASPVFDFSATPMWISRANKANSAESPMFEWVASDFGLMDAIESGLVKVPRVPIDDDSPSDQTAWRRIYDKTPHTKLPRRSAEPTALLPEPLEGALQASAAEWKRTFEATKGRQPTPPVMIVVANDIPNAEALYEQIAGCEVAIDDDDGGDEPTVRLLPGRFGDEFSNVEVADNAEGGRWRPELRTLLVHSRLDDENEINAKFKKLLKEQASHLGEDAPDDAVREALNTVGKPGRLGANVRCVISVSMLTEGWDARTVTQIVGFRAFTSQLLCEQVTGRALRRTSYESYRDEPDKQHLLTPEYAEVLGIPFEFMPNRGKEKGSPPPDRTEVCSVPRRSNLRISWPNVVEYRTVIPETRFELDAARVKPASLSEDAAVELVEVAGVTGEPHLLSVDAYQREKAARAWCAAAIANLLTSDGGPDVPDSEIDIRSAGRAGLFCSAYRALGQWLDSPEVECASATVLLRHPSRREFFEQVVAACRFADAAAPPREIRSGSQCSARRRFSTLPIRISRPHCATSARPSAASCRTLPATRSLSSTRPSAWTSTKT